MRSSTGAHYPALDHVRGVAAWLVFTWHFTHSGDGFPVPFTYTPALPLAAVLDEGHTGVALFMTLSGYLFAKLLDGKQLHFPSFVWNRAVRLVPLLTVVIVLAAPWAQGLSAFGPYATRIASGLLFPTLPNGGWSITSEAHFYLLLPLFLWLARRWRLAPIGIIVAAIFLRYRLHHRYGEVQMYAYWTIIGRVDQFVAGILAFSWRHEIAARRWLVAAAFAVFVGIYWYFDATGGFWLSDGYPSGRRLWIVLPAIEGMVYGSVIATYDRFAPRTHGWISRLIANAGEYSYSIYLLHYFVVFDLAQPIHKYVMRLSSFPIACGWATLCFFAMLMPAHLSFRFVEAPCLRWRRRYVVERVAVAPIAYTYE